MPVGDVHLVPLLPISGVKIGVCQAGVRYPNRRDLTIFEIDKGSSVAVVTTQNYFVAAPVQVVREHIQTHTARYLIINTGNANAGTGQEGIDKAKAICQALAQKCQVEEREVLPYSTGVIGEPLPSDRIIAGIDKACADLQADNWLNSAYGIMTTDTTPKGHSTQTTIDGITYTVTGISKGAGMIRPNMATMLAFVATDANISQPLLQQMLADITNQTFNRITIDGDTSTNDCCTLISTAKVGTLIDSEHHDHYQVVYDSIKAVMLKIAQLIVRDGEGATKFITVKVSGGKRVEDCTKIAYAIAHSPLVKTAFFASDPNWGRILASVGYAGVPLDQRQISVWLDEVAIYQRGGLVEGYTEAQGQAVMSRPEIQINIDLGQGDCTDTVYTCDLSHDYVSINADYRS